MNKLIERIVAAMREDPGSAELIQGEAEHLTRVALKVLRDFDVMSLDLEYPQPMFFGDAWVEVFEDALKEPA